MNAIKNVKVMVNTSDEAKAVEGSEMCREGTTPSNPSMHFFNSV